MIFTFVLSEGLKDIPVGVSPFCSKACPAKFVDSLSCLQHSAMDFLYQPFDAPPFLRAASSISDRFLKGMTFCCGKAYFQAEAEEAISA